MTISSVAALAPIPLTPAYSLSKAAAFNLTQALRMLLAGQGVRVHAALCGPVDTEMVRDPEVPKTPPETVATAVFDGVDRGEEDIFPDPFARRCPTAGAPARQGTGTPERGAPRPGITMKEESLPRHRCVQSARPAV